jgi:lysozyme
MLKRGDRGPQVLTLQRHLLRLGYPLPRFGADASLGGETLAAVRLLEQDRHWTVSPNDIVQDSTLAAVANARPYLRGLDVSKWQGEIDWPRVASAGYRWVYVKAAEGRTGTDPAYARNIAGARAAGLVAGPYMFWHPERDPLEQARHFARVAGPHQPGQLPPVLDVERENDLTPIELNARMQALINETRRLFGAVPVIYSSRRVYSEWGLSVGGECPFWMVSWSSRERLVAPWSRWTFWQTGPAKGVPGIEGEVDRNLFNGGEAELRALAGW